MRMICVCVCTGVYVHMNACEDKRLILSIFFDHPPRCVLRQSLSLKPRPQTWLVSLGSLFLGIPSLPPELSSAHFFFL